jgi:hypothetical protein
MKAIRMLFAIALLLGVASVYSQAENVAFLKVSIPFNFTVDNQKLPVGDYTISDSDLNPQSVIWLRSADGQHVVVVRTHQTFMLTGSANAKLIFQRSGSEYFLSQIWTLGQTTGREVVVPNRAKEMAKNNLIDAVATIVSNNGF